MPWLPPGLKSSAALPPLPVPLTPWKTALGLGAGGVGRVSGCLAGRDLTLVSSLSGMRVALGLVTGVFLMTGASSLLLSSVSTSLAGAFSITACLGGVYFSLSWAEGSPGR